MRRLLVSALVAVMVLGAFAGLTGCSGAEESPNDAANGDASSARADYFISIEDVAAAPDSLVIVDARAPEAYAAGHIPGAINAPWQSFASVGVGAPGDPDWGTLLTPAEIGTALGSLGIDTNNPVVIYGDPNGWGEDGRVLWTLLSVGVENARIMDGGYPAWAASGNEMTTEVTEVTPVTVTVANTLDSSLNITTDELIAGLDTITVVDSRSAKEYDGATDFGEARGGHIPGAVNVPYPEVFNADGTVKSDAELEAMFDEAGLTDKDAEIVFYCTKGIRSAHMALLARMLGYENAKNYDASYYSWAGNTDLEVEK